MPIWSWFQCYFFWKSSLLASLTIEIALFGQGAYHLSFPTIFFFTCIFICFLSLLFIVVSSVSGISTVYCKWITESKSFWWSCPPRIVEASSFNCHWTRHLRKQPGEAPVLHPPPFPTSLCSNNPMSLCFWEPLAKTNTVCLIFPVYLVP